MKRVNSGPFESGSSMAFKKPSITIDYQNVLLEIFEWIAREFKKESELAAWAQVSTLFNKKVIYIQKQDDAVISKYNIFGRRDWQIKMELDQKYNMLTKIGIIIGDAPRIPLCTAQIMESPCPFWKGKKIHETHLMTLMPMKINGKPLTLLSLDVQFENFDCQFFKSEEHGNTPISAPYWILMPNTVLDESRNKSLIKQLELIDLVNQKGCNYTLPKCIEAKVCIVMHLFKTGKTFYNGGRISKRSTYTRCEEIAHETIYRHMGPERWHLGIGGFEANGLIIRETDYDSEDYGVAPVLRL